MKTLNSQGGYWVFVFSSNSGNFDEFKADLEKGFVGDNSGMK